MEERAQGRPDLKRFLISRLSSLGDVVCSLPAATAMKKGHPGCQVVWVVDARFEPVVAASSSVDAVVPIPSKGGSRRKLSSEWPVLGEPFDAALDLQGLLKSASVLMGVKATEKLGYHWQREGAALFSSRVLPDPTSLHVVDQYVDVARAAGGVADRAEFAMVPDPEATATWKGKLPERFLAVNPGAAWASKRWPPERFASVIERLDIPTVMLGAKGETGAVEIRERCKTDSIDLTGQTSIADLIAVIGLAAAHLGGDTGSTHIAAALGIPAIGLYSSTRPERTCPYGQIERCHYDPEGLAGIEPDAVLRTVEEALA